ncbi:MAG TPA: peptidylprolyl isomerase [Streptosporangiaceae bacterium]|nr:peptidylprolyl isomerase [Streptosporangiaceae bacterium]
MAGKKERQRRLARERYQRRTVRQAQRARRARQWTISVLAAVAVAGIAVGSVFLATRSSSPSAGATPSASATPTPSPSVSPTPAPTPVAEPAHQCTYTASGTASRKVSPPAAKPDYKASYRATITTNLGNIVIDLLNSKATCTVNSFISLASQKFYNGTPCPRLTTSGGLYILQCGDPTGTGSGGPGYAFASENLTGATYPAGTLAMANTGVPDSNGSQFFLVYKNSTLAPSYTPFGTIVSGLNILQTVGSRGFGPPLNSAGGGAPKDKVDIERVTISKT